MKNKKSITNINHDRMPGQLAETGIVLGKPACRMFWLLIAMYETTPKSSRLYQHFYYISWFCESGIQSVEMDDFAIPWGIHWGHLVVCSWQLVCFGKVLRWIHSHACCLSRDSWKNKLSLFLPFHCNLRVSTCVLPLSIQTSYMAALES